MTHDEFPFSVSDENIRHGRLSPGPIKNEEVLIRVSYHPEHIENGLLKDSAVSLADLKQRGFSMDREQYANSRVIQRRIEKQQAKTPHSRAQAFRSRVGCGAIRGIRDDVGIQALVVIDEPVERDRSKDQDENRAHTCVYSGAPRTDAHLRKIRSNLGNLLRADLAVWIAPPEQSKKYSKLIAIIATGIALAILLLIFAHHR